jgi:hypothetical protein
MRSPDELELIMHCTADHDQIFMPWNYLTSESNTDARIIPIGTAYTLRDILKYL